MDKPLINKIIDEIAGELARHDGMLFLEVYSTKII